jgi:hypothetical protein
METMKYTTEYMEQLFESINFDLFDDKLDKPIFLVLNDIIASAIIPDFEIDGVCVPFDRANKYIIGIHENNTPLQFFNTMVHELIHIYCFEKWNYRGHGKKFKEICEKAVDIYY